MEEMYKAGIVAVGYNGNEVAEDRGWGEKIWSFQAVSRHSTPAVP